MLTRSSRSASGAGTNDATRRAALLHAVRTVAGRSALDPHPPRELEVFTGLARGRSKAEIAAELVLSDTTVKSHVAHILAKLDLRGRIRAVVLGYECGLARPGG